MISACLNSGHAAEANSWLKKAVADESYAPTQEELMFLSNIEKLCGNNETSLVYSKRANEIRVQIQKTLENEMQAYRARKQLKREQKNHAE